MVLWRSNIPNIFYFNAQIIEARWQSVDEYWIRERKPIFNTISIVCLNQFSQPDEAVTEWLVFYFLKLELNYQ